MGQIDSFKKVLGLTDQPTLLPTDEGVKEEKQVVVRLARKSTKTKKLPATACRRRGLKRRRSGNGLDSPAGKPIGATLGLLIRQKMGKFAL